MPPIKEIIMPTIPAVIIDALPVGGNTFPEGLAVCSKNMVGVGVSVKKIVGLGVGKGVGVTVEVGIGASVIVGIGVGVGDPTACAICVPEA
jgi:hypothetical protein